MWSMRLAKNCRITYIRCIADERCGKLRKILFSTQRFARGDLFRDYMRRHGTSAEGADHRWNNRTRDTDVDYRVKVTRNGTTARTLREYGRVEPLQFEIPFYFGALRTGVRFARSTIPCASCQSFGDFSFDRCRAK